MSKLNLAVIYSGSASEQELINSFSMPAFDSSKHWDVSLHNHDKAITDNLDAVEQAIKVLSQTHDAVLVMAPFEDMPEVAELLSTSFSDAGPETVVVFEQNVDSFSHTVFKVENAGIILKNHGDELRGVSLLTGLTNRNSVGFISADDIGHNGDYVCEDYKPKSDKWRSKIDVHGTALDVPSNGPSFYGRNPMPRLHG